MRFKDFFDRHVLPLTNPHTTINGMVTCAQDGYRTTLCLEDALADDVILADELGRQPLTIEHEAPLRLVAPALSSIDLADGGTVSTGHV